MAKIDVFEVAPKKGDMPFTPYLHIYLSEHSSDSEGHRLLSPQLMTDKEIDEAIDFLIMQLEKGEKNGKIEIEKSEGTRQVSFEAQAILGGFIEGNGGRHNSHHHICLDKSVTLPVFPH